MSIHERIRTKRKELGLTQPELAKQVGVSKGAIGQWETGPNKPRGSNLVKLASVLGKSPDWLLTGKEPKKSAKGNVVPIGTYENTMPLISMVKAGAWCESPDLFEPGDADDWLPRPKNASDRAFAVRVEGDSMTAPYPGQRSYPEGTIIYVDPERPVTNGARVVARTPSGNYTFKCFVDDVDAGRKYLRPINDRDYEKIDITEDMHICGVVIGSYLPE